MKINKQQKDNMKEVINWLNSNCYFHRMVYNESGTCFENRIIVRLENYVRFDTEWIKFNEVFHDNTLYYLHYQCTVGWNYIVIETI